MLPFLVDNLGIMNWLDKIKREKDEASSFVKVISERERDLAWGCESETIVSEAEMITDRYKI